MNTLTRVLRRILIILAVCVFVFIVGTMIGYAVGGGSPFAVFAPSTWTHIADFLK